MSALRQLIILILAIIAALAVRSARAEMPWRLPVAQPFYDLPWQAEHQGCRPPPPTWDCPNVEQDFEGEPCGPVDDGLHPIAHRKCGWYFSADGVPLMYDGNARRDFARRGVGGPTVLSHNSFQTEFDAGAKFNLGFALTDRMAIEGGFNGSYSYSGEAEVRDTTANPAGGQGVLESPFSNFGNPALLAGFDSANLAAITFHNSYSTADINFRYRFDVHPGPFDFWMYVGVRQATVNELLTYHTFITTPARTNDVNVRTFNELWGPQLGFSSNALVNERLWIAFDIKGSILNNSARQATVFTNTTAAGAVNVINTGRGEQRTAFIGDLSFLGNYQLTKGLTVRAGYQATWVTGLALAVDNFQSDVNLLTLGPGQLVHDGTAVYHGPVLGIEWAR